jgi:hypothetical protein
MLPFQFKTGGHGIVRFVHFFNYPEGTSVDDGEKWYFGEHVPQASRLPGLLRYRTWRTRPPIPLPSPDPYDRFVRMSEMVFENMEMCRQVMANSSLWTPSSEGVPGFREFECMFLDEEPQYDLLRDVPVQQYNKMALPTKYAGGPPAHREYHLEDSEDTVIDVYFFNYRDDIPFVEGEDWYLGHHTREGRHAKQVGVKHYQTWKTIRVPEDSLLHPNRFYRLTELGLPLAGFREVSDGGSPARLLYTQSQFGRVIDEWRNLIIDPNDAQDLLK